jgi:hypothetical protein
MKTTIHIPDAQEQLLQARVQGLQQQERGSLRPHGKLWGMDVFSWYNPALGELENTMSSFPAPVLWLGNEKDILALFEMDHSALSNLHLVCTHDKGGFAQAFPVERMDSLPIVLGTKELRDALELMRALKEKHGVLLFTASGENWREVKAAFDFFLDLHQV